MKKIILLLSILCTTVLFAQEKSSSLSTNTIIMREVGPIWPGCDNGDVQTQQNCFNQKLAQHVAKNYKYPPEAYKRNEQGKVVVEFVINEKGLVDIEKVSGGTPLLRAEAKRNILEMPKMAQPGMLGGKPHPIKFTVPFTFKTGK